MPARKWVVAGRTFSKVSSPLTRTEKVHVVEEGRFWKGRKSWEHHAACGESITGVPVTYSKVNCKGCRRFIEGLQEQENAAARRAAGER